MDKNLLNIKESTVKGDEERQQFRVTKSEYVNNLNSTLKNTTNVNNRNELISTVNKNDYNYNSRQNNEFEDFNNVQNPLEDASNPVQYQYNAPPPNPMLHNNNPMNTNLFGNYQNEYSQPQFGQMQGGYPNNQSQNYQPPQFNSPYQQPPQQFNVSYPGQNNLSPDQAMYRSQSNSEQGFQISDEQKKYLIIGALVCLFLILFIF